MGQIKNIKLHIVTDIKMASVILKSEISMSKKLLHPFCRNFSITHNLSVKRKWISKWKNAFPTQVYTDVDLEERCFDKIIQYGGKSKLHRHRMFTLLIEDLITKERLVLTVNKGKSLARLAEHMIDMAKQGDEVGVYTLLNRKELVPRVFEDLLPRYLEQDGKYTNLYRIHSESLPYYVRDKHDYKNYKKDKKKGNLLHRKSGNSVIEFVGNPLPPLLLPQEELERLTLGYFEKKRQ